MEHLTEYQKLDWISFGIQEALNGNNGELMKALELVEDLREKADLPTCEDWNDAKTN